jgi:hypothetical protein
MQITPLKPGNIKITGVSFRYWNIIDDSLQFDPIVLNASNEKPSIEISFIGNPELLLFRETIHFTCRITNFGDSAASQIYVISDNCTSFKFEDKCSFTQGHRITQVVKPEDPLLQSTHRDIKCTVSASEKGSLLIRMLFIFQGEKEKASRSIPYILKFNVEEREKTSFEFSLHPLSTDKLLLCAEIETRDAGCEVSNIEIKGRKINDFTPVNIPSFSSYFYVLDIEDDASKSIDPNTTLDDDAIGVLTLNTSDGHVQHHLIKNNNPPAIRYSLNAQPQISFKEGLTVPVEFIIKNCSPNDLEDLVISPITCSMNINSETKSTNIIWIGCTKKKCKLLKTGEEKRIKFYVSPILPGIYNVSTFLVTGKKFTQTVDLSHVIFVR